ncbi:hypothetical protein QVD17_35700 [Tagetes erecta]|uniref:DUF4378 domain-containing protein n=1 Tax=Tagetes erecta TaxID=13708 RepID=A0AAD8JQZ4_TARER|nr:hypothetical protein QVD17_35700 [Tagetes erecta]
MGKQWLLCKVAGDAAAASSSSSSSTTGKSRKKDKQTPSSSSSSFGGCLSNIFHLFSIHHHHLPFHQPSFIPDSSIIIPHQQQPSIIPKGAEAPRNSLELDHDQQPTINVAQVAASSSSSSSSSKLQQQTNFNIPLREIQIKTKRTSLLSEDASSECSSSSPSTKTPNLVARLMGLDLLPENSSPRPSSSSPRISSSSSYTTPLNPLSKLSSSSLKYNHTRSLPSTPRVSTAGPGVEVDYNHRFSLKENKRRYDESTSEYAKQIAKQVKENISRRVGADITNNSLRKNNEYYRRDEYLVVLKPKRPSSSSPPPSAVATDKSRNLDHGYERGKENYESIPVSCSSRLRLLEIKKNFTKPNSNLNIKPVSSTSEAIKAPPPLMKDEVQVLVKQDQKPLKVQKCKKMASEKYDLRLKNMHQQEEPFVKKQCNKKSTPLSNDLVKVNTTSKFISFKKDIASPPSTTTTISSQKQVPLPSITHLPSCQNRSFNINRTSTSNSISLTTTATGTSVMSDHSDYISRILRHTGIEKTTPISISHWYSPSHPLHPSIFHQIEKHLHPTTTFLTDRKLIFEAVDELLVNILKPYISLKPWVTRHRNCYRMYGSELVEKLNEKIRCFPGADCQVLEDIDMLIESDMRMCTRVIGTTAFEEEAEELVTEMERDMVDTLVDEMAGIIFHVGRGNTV